MTAKREKSEEEKQRAREVSHQWYLEHKNDPEYKERRRRWLRARAAKKRTERMAEAHYVARTAKCVVCGKTFVPSNPLNTMCSPECKKARQKEFISEWTKKHRRKTTEGSLWASDKEAILNADVEAAMERMRDKACVVCGKIFTTADTRQICCSKECRRKRRIRLTIEAEKRRRGLSPLERDIREAMRMLEKKDAK